MTDAATQKGTAARTHEFVRSSPRPAGWISALGPAFWLSLRQQVRGRRLLVLTGLFLLPVGIGILARWLGHAGPAETENALLFVLIPHALVPLTALLYACGMIQDEIEEQTLTYLLVRPLPRWALYLAKLAATILVTIALTTVFVFATYVVAYWGDTDLWGKAIPVRAFQTSALLGLNLVAYDSLFGWLGLLVRRFLVIGVGYIVLFEGLLANIDFAVRRITVMYYFRVLAGRWLGIDTKQWSIDVADAPTSGACVSTLLVVAALATVAATAAFSTREFRLKTPEGS